jgi:predicted acetyltransferase
LPLPASEVIADELRLLPPSLELLPGYEAALAAGWSPDTERDASTEQLAALRRNPHAFLFELTRQDGTVFTASGRAVRRLPGRVYWLNDGDFSGTINLRYMQGTDRLPDYVSGHIGYAVVPWRRRRGYATRALALILPIAREIGLRQVDLTCDRDNDASGRVIVKNGGALVGQRREAGGKIKLVFRIDLAQPE